MKVSDDMKYTENRSLLINILFFIISLVSMFFGPLIFALLLKNIISNKEILELISNLLFIGVLYLMYFKDLNREAKLYFENFKDFFKTGFKYYFVGVLVMMFSNLLISFIIKDISANENLVRSMLFEMPLYTMISITIIAPLSEELIFRKSLAPIIKNKWIYAFVCGLLFGSAHLLAGELTFINLLYLLPYGSLGFVFALMNYETKTTWTSIIMHGMHNCVTGIVLLITYLSGAL